MIRFNQDTELTLITDYDEENDNITGEETEVFKAGEPVDAEIIAWINGGEYVDLQFGDGSVALTVQRDCFTHLRDHLFSPETNCCVHCGISAEDDCIENGPCVPSGL